MSIILDGTTGVTFPNGVTMADGTSSPVTAAQGGTGLSSVGSAGNTLFTTNGTSWSSTAKIVQGTIQNSTSGTAIIFTGIPSWAKRVTMMISNVSTNGNSPIQIQIGSGSLTTTGYISTGSVNGTGIQSSTTGFVIGAGGSSTDFIHGVATISNLNANVWVASGALSQTNAFLRLGAGISPSLSGALDRIALTTINGTDTFDSGTINILYE